SSLGSLFAGIIGKRVSTRSGHGNDSPNWADRNRAPWNHLITSLRLMCFCAVVAATMFPTLAFSGPQQVSPPQTEATEVSVVQLPPGTRLHSARHAPTLATPHPPPASATPP